MSGKVKSVEGLRGFACLAVLLSHLSLMFYPYLHGMKPEQIKSGIDQIIVDYPIGFFYAGTSAVFVFFCLSGYILTYACAKNENVLLAATKMLLARYFRLVMPVLASVIICFIVIKYIPNNTSGLPWISWWGRSVTDNDTLIGAIYNGVFSSVFLADNKYNWVIWTMQIELLGSYLLLCSIPVICNIKYRSIVCISICIIIIICSPTKLGISYASFFLGASIYWIKTINNKAVSMALLLTGLYLAGFKELNHWYSWLNKILYIELPGGMLSTYYFVPMLSGFVLVLTAVKTTALKYFIESDFAMILGKISFSAYLIQIPIFYSITPIINIYANNLTNNYNVSAVISIIVSLIAVYYSSKIFNIFVDEKSIKLSRYISKSVISSIDKKPTALDVK
jgi:peptidoglycan/LPS O-acetylase OafA/YrhL